LKNIRGILNVDLCLEKTVKLEVKSCSFTEITKWNSQSTLEHLVIRDCANLQSFPPLGNISTVIVSVCSKVKIQFGNQNKFSFHGQSLTFETMQLMSTKNLQDLLLVAKFPGGFNDFSFCHDIPILSLCSVSYFKPFLSFFHGKSNTLSGFNLARWSGKLFPNVEKCHLNYCSELSQWPDMPKVERIKVAQCHDFTMFPSFPSLKKLGITSCRNLSEIFPSPQVTKFAICYCSQLEVIPGFVSVKTLKIAKCDKLSVVLSMKSALKVEIKDCRELGDLKEMAKEWSESAKKTRTVRLSSAPRSDDDRSFWSSLATVEAD
jgi:hypothetical protein